MYAQREKSDKLDSIVVAATQVRTVRRTQISAVSLPASVIFAMPATMGEPDVLKSLQMIPGVVGAGDGNVALHIRGGASSQNLFIVDGAVLYNPEHFKGYVSAFNPVAVNDVILYKGGFPAQYGNRLSGIVDTELKRGDFNKYHGSANVGLFAASALVSGPIIKDKLSFMISGRRSFYKEVTSNIVDLLYSREDKEGIQYSKEALQVPFENVTFYDFNAKLSYKPTKRSIIDLSFYNGRDVNKLNADTTISRKRISFKGISDTRYGESVLETVNSVRTTEKWGNTLASLNWSFNGDNVNVKTSLSYSRYRFEENYHTINDYNTRYQEYGKGQGSDGFRLVMDQLMGWEQDVSDSQYESSIDRFQIANINTIKEGVLAGLEFGFDASYITYDPYTSFSYQRYKGEVDNIYHNITSQTMIKDSSSITGVGTRDLITGGIFANYNFNIGKSVEVDASLRGSIHVTNGKTYIYPEPRINAVFNATEKLAFKASYSFMAQSEHKVSTEDLLEDSDIWMPSGKGIKPSTSHQVALGAFYDFKSDKGYAISLEGYYKTMNDILEYKEKAVTADYANDWVNSVAVGDGWAYGFEFLAQKTKGKTKGWVSYTWSKSLEKFDREGMILNQGNEFFAPHDCRHSVSVNATYDLGKNFELSATFSYHTGRYRTIHNLGYGITPGDNEFFSNKDLHLSVAAKRNNVKIDDYHKLDVVINYYINHNTGKSTVTFGVTNIYNNYNIAYIRGASNNRLRAVCLFPIMPSISYSYSF